jgi:hypothetical protein
MELLCKQNQILLLKNPWLVLCLQVVGMGLLLTFIGMQSSKIVVPDAETMVSHVLFVVQLLHKSQPVGFSLSRPARAARTPFFPYCSQMYEYGE